MTTKTALFINSLELELFLGWPSEERSRKQIVCLDMAIHFPAAPKACASDDLNDTVCYRELIESLRKTICVKKYRLIEHITQDIYDFLKSALPSQSEISVNLTKRPQIQGLGSVTFHFGDEMEKST